MDIMNNSSRNSKEESLLLAFNRREEVALGEVYDRYHRELLYFARQLYRGTNIEADDVVHDVFIKIWESKKIEFKGLINIKAYIYVSIKNKFLDRVIHNRYINKFNKSLLDNLDNFTSEIIESETFSVITQAVDILPKDTAEIFKLTLDGWNAKEIVDKLGISKSTVYAKRNEAVEILKNKITKNSFVITLINNVL